MGVLPHQLSRDLRDRLGLERAVETGTYRGASARILASIFPEVLTIELDPELHRRAARRLAAVPGITAVEGNSRDRLAPLVDAKRPTLYWLDGHWSGGATAGHDEECPVLDELHALANGHQDDCVLIDDARLFLAPPPPPHKPEQWPSYDELVDGIYAGHAAHHVEVVHDVVVAVPQRAADLVERFRRSQPATPGLLSRILTLLPPR
jgi:hypothetical protein